MKTFEVDTTCPFCGRNNEAHTNPVNDDPPDNGDIGFCWDCKKGSIYSEIDGVMKLVRPEKVEMAPDIRKAVEAQVSLLEDCCKQASGPLEAAAMYGRAQDWGFVPRPQIVRFYEDEDKRNMLAEMRWSYADPWPPPERFMKIVDRSNGVELLASADQMIEAITGDASKEFGERYECTIFNRADCSKLTDEQLKESEGFLTRGANYVSGGEHVWE